MFNTDQRDWRNSPTGLDPKARAALRRLSREEQLECWRTGTHPSEMTKRREGKPLPTNTETETPAA